MDILIVAISALAAALVVLAVAVMWVAARYDRASRELSRYDAAPSELSRYDAAPNELPAAPNELPAAPPRVQGSPASTSTRFLRRARTRASARR